MAMALVVGWWAMCVFFTGFFAVQIWRGDAIPFAWVCLFLNGLWACILTYWIHKAWRITHGHRP